MNKLFKCHPGIGNKVEGIVLCANDNFSARYDLDRINGIFSRPQHKLFGKTYKDKILVLKEGSIAGFSSHGELLANNTSYQNLWELDQFSVAIS